MRRWLARASLRVRRRQHAQLDGRVARRRSRARRCRACRRVVRTRHVSTPVNRLPTTRWLYQRATAHIVVTGEALKAQLVRDNGFDPATHHVGAHGHRPRALPAARSRRSARDAASTRARRSASSPRCATGRATTIFSTPGVECASRSRAGSCSSSATDRAARISNGASRELGTRAPTCDSPATRTTCRRGLRAPTSRCCLRIGDEGVPQSLMQAAACGLPAVSTPIGAIAEAVVDGVTGLLVPPRDVTRTCAGARDADDRRRAARAHGPRRARVRAGELRHRSHARRAWKRCSRARRGAR